MFLSRIAGMIGNVMGNYDKALFALLAPFIAPLFFGQQEPVTALILTYALLPLGILTRPFGSLFFGWMGDRTSRKKALCCSLLGIAIVTLGMGCLPLYKAVGAWAPVGLALGRMLQSFFAAGESTGASLFILENTPPAKRSLFSGFYGASSIVGYVIASGLVTLFCMQGIIEEGWRLLFWLGGATAIFGFFLRLKTHPEIPLPKIEKKILPILIQNRGPLLSVIIAAGFSYTTFALPFTLMNGFVPLVTSLSKTDVMQVNTVLLIIDMLTLPLFGYLATRWGKEKMMFAGAFWSAVGAIPLFYLLDGASLALVIAIRLILMVLGVAFAAPYHAWALEQVAPEHRYTILCLGSALGSQLIGAPASAVGLWLYQQLGWVFAPGLYLVAIAGLACVVIRKSVHAVDPQSL
jgi:MFS family permease